MKKEWSSFLFVVYGALSTVFFALVTPFQFAKGEENRMLPVIFVLGSILCFIVTLLIISSVYAFLDKDTISKKRLVYTHAFNEIFIIIGFALSFALLAILKKNGILIKETTEVKYEAKHAILGIIFGILIFLIPFCAKYLRKVGNKIKTIFKKDKE